MNPEIIRLAAGKPKEYTWNDKKVFSGIGKTEVASLSVEHSNIIGDDVANHKSHGGPDRVVCLYPYEHYAYWNDVFQKELVFPAFGENITAKGMTEAQVSIGDIFQVGSAILQVTQGRVPCVTISNYNDEKQLLKNVVETNRTGYFFRVLEAGLISHDSKITVLEKDPISISIAFATQVLFHQKEDIDSIEKILTTDALSEEWRNRFLKLL